MKRYVFTFFRKIVTDYASRINLFHKRGAATTNNEWP